MNDKEAVNELLMIKKGNSNIKASVLYDIDNPKNHSKYLNLRIKIAPSTYNKLIKGDY